MDEVKKRQILVRFSEFFMVGLVMGIVEDLLAIHFATDAKITWQTFKVALLVAVPFAVFSELIVDSKLIHGWFKKRMLTGK